MDPTQGYDGILDDETLAPLKRNHACLQCKKRKVKCDAIRPTCSPCLRSHAHAIRSANRNQTTAPALTCTYAEGDSPEATSPSEEPRRQTVGGGGTGTKRPAEDQGKRAKTADDEKEALKSRIAELEAKLAGLLPLNDESGTSRSNSFPDISTSNRKSNTWTSDFSQQNKLGSTSTTQTGYLGRGASVEQLGDLGWNNTTTSSARPAGAADGLGDDWMNDLFLVPNNWPKGLPSPFLLEHLVETFFNCVPLTPRMLHRASLLARIKLPPTSPDFPFPGLLHAICAAASVHTAWVNNLAPHLLEVAVQQHVLSGLDLTSIEDFGLAQAATAGRTVDLVASICMMGGGQLIFQLAQTCIILADVYFSKGFPLKGWMYGSQPSRLLNLLDISNRHEKKTHKEPILSPPVNSQEREERLVTVWMAYVLDAGFAANSSFAPSMCFAEIKCDLPTSKEEWKKSFVMQGNPQNPESENLFSYHPVPDSFVLVVKASILLGRVAQWIRLWWQTDRDSEHAKQGMRSESFQKLVHDIETFQSTLPGALRNVFRMMDSTKSSGSFDENFLAVHVLPNIALCLLYEPFAEWDSPNPALQVLQKAYEAIIGTLHLIPSNLDVTMAFTPLMILTLYNLGRVVADFVKNALKKQEYSLAVRHRADLQTVQSLLDRIGQRYALGNAMSVFLENYVRLTGDRKMTPAEACGREITWSGAVTQDTSLSSQVASTSSGSSGLYTVSSNSTSVEAMCSSGQSSSGSGISPAVDTPMCSSIDLSSASTSTKSNQPTPSENAIESIRTYLDPDPNTWEAWSPWPAGVDLNASINANVNVERISGSGGVSGPGVNLLSSNNYNVGNTNSNWGVEGVAGPPASGAGLRFPKGGAMESIPNVTISEKAQLSNLSEEVIAAGFEGVNWKPWG
ncbi:hypothetical protein IAR55_001261 [Kwoniella newhampshirensis]|uniref:Zn(2)-C6 fungal-type domain-containing protein n=1 Tax=Kwoniella newhampshirensis TaxID=1651941 RepID=A0AAW0Z530_9TREE